MASSEDEPMPDAPTQKPPRRFAPELVEESRSSNRSSAPAPATADDEPMIDAPTTKATRRRFAPQLVEESRTTNRHKKSKPSTRDASVQVNDTEMPDAPTARPPRRFAPVPIETTFDSYRVSKNPHGPFAELTPDPSPTTSHPPSSQVSSRHEMDRPTSKSSSAPKRKFAPQLIETTRRARKAGQEGPGTKPVDKTDITPGTNHIYVPKIKKKPGGVGGIGNRPPSTTGVGRLMPMAGTGTGCAEEAAATPSSWVSSPRRQPSMKPHPNTRRATRAPSFHPELETIDSSESGNSSDDNDDTTKDVPVLDVTSPVGSEGDSWNSRNYNLRDRRESCDEEFSGYLLAVAAREAQRQREFDQVMSAFPNGLQPAGVEHFFVRDNSEDDSAFISDEPLRHGPSQLIRRKSTDPGWAVKEMRAHAEKLAQTRNEGTQMGVEMHEATREPEMAPAVATPAPEAALWSANSARRPSHDSPASRSPHLVAKSPAMRGGRVNSRSPANDSSLLAPAGSPAPAASGGLRASPFGVPFAGLRSSENEDEQMRKMRMAASPPMLGGSLTFRRCPSPKHTRMEPGHPYHSYQRPEEQQRDTTENSGLWRGYCSTKPKETAQTPAFFQPPSLLMTPANPSGTSDPFEASFSASMNSGAGTPSGSLSTAVTTTSSVSSSKQSSIHLQRPGGPQSAPALEERRGPVPSPFQIAKERSKRELEEWLEAEFDDAFITQVYNYISLGYPATARAFDEELGKISGISIEELRRDDHKEVTKGFMLEMELRVKTSSSESKAKSDGDDDTAMRSPEEDEQRSREKPPRWIALRMYIREWARQHPSLGDDENPLAWGVRARRGSWAI